MTDQNNIIGERIRFYRTSRDVSLAKLAESLPRQLTGQQLAKYETGYSRWPADLVMEIAGLLAVDVRLLLGMNLEEVRTDGDQWEAERYKSILLHLSKKMRDLAYRIIDVISAL